MMTEDFSSAELFANALAEQLGQSLLHEDCQQFLAAIEPYMLADAVKSMQPILPLMFSALPKASNGFSFETVKMPKRNDDCPCGSGKKLKKCCPQILEYPAPKANELFILALGSLSENDYEALAQKPNWSLQAATEYFQQSLETGFFQSAMVLLIPLLDDLAHFRNEHQELVSYMFDILFEVGEDEMRILLMEDISQLNQAPALQSIAHQRLAMIFSQQGAADKSQYHLQQAFRCDPNQAELPMTEMSILGVIADETEIKARAKFWQVRLKKKYSEHPVLDFLEQILLHGKVLFNDYREEYHNEFEREFGPSELEGEHAQRLFSLLNNNNTDQNYDIIKTGADAKLALTKSLKPIYKHWLALYEGASKDIAQLYANEGKVMDADDIDYFRWDMPNPEWLDFLQQHPLLFNNFEVLLRLSAHIHLAPIPEKDDELLESESFDSEEELLSQLSIFTRMQIAYKERYSTVIMETMASIPPNVYLPRRFKGNESFWLLAEDYSIELHEGSELGLQQIYLSSLLALEKSPPLRLINSLMLNHFEQGKLALILERYECYSKPNLAMTLVAACAYQAQGNSQIASAVLAKVKGKARLTLLAFYQALQEHSISILFSGDIEYGIIPLCNQLLEVADQSTGQRESDSKDNRFIKQSYLWLKAHIAEDLS